MKKTARLMALLALVGTQIAYSQNFTYTATVTEKQAQPGQLAQFYSEIHNLESYPVTFWIEMDTTRKPLGWNVQFCTNWYCWPPWVTLDTNAVIPAGDMDSILVDIYPDSVSPECWITMRVYPEGHYELVDSITFHAYVPGGVNDEVPSPGGFALLRAFPNPFNGAVNLTFAVSAPAVAGLNVFDPSGRRIANLFSGAIGAGEQRLFWHPGEIASGIYLARLEVDGRSFLRKILYLR